MPRPGIKAVAPDESKPFDVVGIDPVKLREACLRGTIAPLQFSPNFSVAVERCVMTVKNIVVELEDEYLQKAAKERGVSCAKLVRLLMKKVIAEELVWDILGDGSLADAEPPPKRYRRFRERENPGGVTPRRPSKRASSLGRLASPSDSKFGFDQTGRNDR